MIDPDFVRDSFRRYHGREPRIFSAPGRVNLIGEHTDYNDGYALPMAIDRGMAVAAAPRNDRRLRARSLDLDAEVEVDLDAPGSRYRGSWIDYIEGVAQALVARGIALQGADLVLASDVPAGAGLSSSAALELSVGLALTRLSGEEVDPVVLAQAGQTAEHEFVGTQCGLMDQLVAALAEADHALLIDFRTIELRPVPLRLASAVVVICDSRVKHELATSSYNTRRSECQQAVELLRAQMPEIRALRDVSAADLERCGQRLPASLLRRCRHVVGENARTLEAAEALERGEVAALGRLLEASHRSLRDDYDVSCAELDLLVEIAAETPGVLGGRMTGGGFGGCTVNLVEGDSVDRFEDAVTRRFEARFGRRPAIFLTRAQGGATEVL